MDAEITSPAATDWKHGDLGRIVPVSQGCDGFQRRTAGLIVRSVLSVGNDHLGVVLILPVRWVKTYFLGPAPRSVC